MDLGLCEIFFFNRYEKAWVFEIQSNNTSIERLDTLRHELLSCDLIEGRMLGKATRGRKRLQMLSDVSSKTYKVMKTEDGDGNR